MSLAPLPEIVTVGERLALLSVDKAASYTGLSAAYLNKLRVTGGGPIYMRLGKRVLYRISDIDSWLDSKRRISTAATGEYTGGGANYGFTVRDGATQTSTPTQDFRSRGSGT